MRLHGAQLPAIDAYLESRSDDELRAELSDRIRAVQSARGIVMDVAVYARAWQIDLSALTIPGRRGHPGVIVPIVCEAWVTDADLAAARQRFTDSIPGYRVPVAYGAARIDGDNLVFAHVNRPGEIRPLPAVVLASVAGYSASTTAVCLSSEHFQRAIQLLEPAEAATHMPHPNLWSWREIAANAGPESQFVAFFVADLDDSPVNDLDARFRDMLAINNRAAG